MTTVQASVFSGGFYDNETTKGLSKRVTVIACLAFWVYVVQIGISFTDPVTQVVFTGDTSKLGENVDQDLKDSFEIFAETLKTTLIVSLVLSLIIMFAIMYCGWMGSKNQDRSLISTFTCCSGLCAFCSALSILGSFVSINSATCAEIEEFGLSPTICYASIGFDFVLFLLYCFGAIFSNQLYTVSNAIVIIPAPNITYQAKPVGVEPTPDQYKQDIL